MSCKENEINTEEESGPHSTSFVETDLIENMTSFLEASAVVDIDRNVLRNMAVAFTKHLNDTSPGTLQDVTMENPYGVGYRSPCVSLQPFQGSTSPAGQGRSVREFEEQMATLRKENFNLKLRLYFMEEGMTGYQQAANTAEGQETLLKQLIDIKVEKEIIRKELQEKQEILKDAAHAMNEMEKIQKETEHKYQEMVEELKQKIRHFETERDLDKSATNGELMNDLLEHSEVSENVNALQRIRELEGLLKQSDEKLKDFQLQISELDDILAKRDETIKEYEDKVKELVFQNSELLEAIENKDMDASNLEVQQLREDLQKCKVEMADKTCEMQDLEDALKNRNELYDKARFAIQQLVLNIHNQQTEINRLKSDTTNSQSTTNLPNNSKEVASNSAGVSGLESSGLNCSLSDPEAFNELPLSQKQKYEIQIKQQEAVIQSLRAEVKKKTADLQNLVNKELWEKNREIERLNKMLNKATLDSQLPPADNNNSSHDGGELQKSFTDADFAKAVQRNKFLQRKVDILLQRLDSLRNSETVISQLRIDLKKARADAESADKWRRECADFSATLSTRLEELAGFLNSLLKHKDVLGILAVDKRKAMRRAVDRSLDLSKTLNMTLSVSGLSMTDQSLAELHNLSDILGDVEGGLANQTFNSHEELHSGSHQQPSIETLKAENKALKKELDKRRSADNKKERRSLPLSVMVENRESESEAWSEPDRKVSMARIGLEDHSASKEQPSVQQAETDSDFSESAQPDSRSVKSRTQERINQLEQTIQQRDNRILELQCQLMDAENLLKKEQSRVEEVSQELEDLRNRNKELHDDLVAIGSQEPSNIANNESMLMRQMEEKTRSLEKMQEEHERLMVESRLAEMQINALKEDMDNMKRNYEEALMQASGREKEQLSLLRQEMENQMKTALQVKEDEYEECRRQLCDLQRQYVEAQKSIDCLLENEQELKQALVESELATRNLQKQIDESTLRASKATMERVKALNDKLQLEKRCEELAQELATYQTEHERLRQQNVHLENEQKSLQERLVKAESMKATAKSYDACQSGYTSEEVPMVSAVAHNAVTQQRIGEQRIQNSSPDLGIESDAGRVSSVELSNAQRPLLKTIEMSSNVDNKDTIEGLSLENIMPQAATGQENIPKKHDCLKVEQENAELRRKLLRTKRALEDTYEKLRNANHRKAQIEKDIKNQILKTQNVLKHVRSNLENEL